MHSGLVFNIQRYSLHDGPGIRTIVFLKGCPLRCLWCHNPEGMGPEPEILCNPSRCLACGRCREDCPVQGAGPIGQEGRSESEFQRCTCCGACAQACPAEARRLVGRRRTAAEVLAEIPRDRVFHEDSGGGATFSGGEPLMQPQFLMALLEACRNCEIHTAIDTSGYVRQEDLLAAARCADLFLYDLKILDDERHRQYTGVSNRLILENLHALGQMHRNIWVRMPLIPGVRQVNLLPYHATGAAKFARLGKTYPGGDLVPTTAELIEQTAARLQNLGVPVISGG
jgi:pyruvate formate lyase activating enzyme